MLFKKKKNTKSTLLALITVVEQNWKVEEMAMVYHKHAPSALLEQQTPHISIRAPSEHLSAVLHGDIPLFTPIRLMLD